MAIAWMVFSFIVLFVISAVDSFFAKPTFPSLHTKDVPIVVYLITLGGSVPFVLLGLFPRFRAMQANGEKPWENARRQKAYEEAVAAALKQAEPLKAAEDHRLRVQIRELESSAKTVSDKEAEVRRLLPT